MTRHEIIRACPPETYLQFPLANLYSVLCTEYGYRSLHGARSVWRIRGSQYHPPSHRRNKPFPIPVSGYCKQSRVSLQRDASGAQLPPQAGPRQQSGKHTPLSAYRCLHMENAHGAARVSRPYESELERTIQELNSRKRQLEDTLHQVCFKIMPHASAALLTRRIAEGICRPSWCRTLGKRFLGDHNKRVQ